MSTDGFSRWERGAVGDGVGDMGVRGRHVKRRLYALGADCSVGCAHAVGGGRWVFCCYVRGEREADWPVETKNCAVSVFVRAPPRRALRLHVTCELCLCGLCLHRRL